MVRDLGAAPTVNGVLQRAAANDWRAVRLPDGRQVGPREARWRDWLWTAPLEDRMDAWDQLPEPPPVIAAAPEPASHPTPVAGSPEEFALANGALQHAIRCGLDLPPLSLYWFDAAPGETYRGLTFYNLRPVVIYLRKDLEPTQLVRTVLHELHHAADAGLDLSTDDREARAEAFVRQAMARW